MTAKKSSMFNRWMLALCFFVLLAAMAPSTVLARASDDDVDDKVYDARLQGYSQTVQLDSGSTALSWLLLAALGVVAVSVMFKDAKRTHLD